MPDARTAHVAVHGCASCNLLPLPMTVQNPNPCEHNLFGSDDSFPLPGGMVARMYALTGGPWSVPRPTFSARRRALVEALS